MQVTRAFGATVVLGVVVAACGGSAPATQAPGATQGGGGGGATQAAAPTAAAEATDGGGGGGDGGNTIGFTYGKVTFTVTGPVTAQGEYGFLPPASMFGGAQGSILNFASSQGSDANLLSIVVNQDGTVVVSFTSAALGQVPAATCTTSDWNVGAGSGSGKFDCTASMSLTPSGAAVAGGGIKGEFTAHT